MTTLRDGWPADGLRIAPESPVGFTPATTRKHITRQLCTGDSWFSEDGNTVYWWTGTEAIIIIQNPETPTP